MRKIRRILWSLTFVLSLFNLIVLFANKKMSSGEWTQESAVLRGLDSVRFLDFSWVWTMHIETWWSWEQESFYISDGSIVWFAIFFVVTGSLSLLRLVRISRSTIQHSSKKLAKEREVSGDTSRWETTGTAQVSARRLGPREKHTPSEQHRVSAQPSQPNRISSNSTKVSRSRTVIHVKNSPSHPIFEVISLLNKQSDQSVDRPQLNTLCRFVSKVLENPSAKTELVGPVALPVSIDGDSHESLLRAAYRVDHAWTRVELPTKATQFTGNVDMKFAVNIMSYLNQTEVSVTAEVIVQTNVLGNVKQFFTSETDSQRKERLGIELQDLVDGTIEDIQKDLDDDDDQSLTSVISGRVYKIDSLASLPKGLLDEIGNTIGRQVRPSHELSTIEGATPSKAKAKRTQKSKAGKVPKAAKPSVVRKQRELQLHVQAWGTSAFGTPPLIDGHLLVRATMFQNEDILKDAFLYVHSKHRQPAPKKMECIAVSDKGEIDLVTVRRVLAGDAIKKEYLAEASRNQHIYADLINEEAHLLIDATKDPIDEDFTGESWTWIKKHLLRLNIDPQTLQQLRNPALWTL